jgi:hypothetical protein
MDCILNITEPFKVITEGNQYAHSNLQLNQVVQQKQQVSIGVHVRRGDLLTTDRTRYLPDAYYVGVLSYLLTLLNNNNIFYSIEYFVDLPKGDNFFVNKNMGISWDFVPQALTTQSIYKRTQMLCEV